MDISTPIGSDDTEIFTDIINTGIDSRLEGFTRSNFIIIGNRLSMDFHESELQILIRRLLETENSEAEQWADDIVSTHYGTQE